MKKRFFSLQYKVLIFSVVLILIPIFIIGFFSYKKSLEIVQQKVSISNMNTVRQVGEGIDFIFRDVHDMTLFLIQNRVVREFFKLEGPVNDAENRLKSIELYNELTYLISSKPYISSIYFKGFNGVSMDTVNAYNAIDKETENTIIKLRGGYIWDTGTITNYDGSEVNVFSIIRVVNDMNMTPNKLAIMKINISEEDLSRKYSDKIFGEGDDFFIVDSGDRIVSSIDKSRLGQRFKLAIPNDEQHGLQSGYFQYELSGQDYLITYYNIDSVGYRLINLVPLSELLEENHIIREFMLKMAGVSFLLCILVAFLFSIKVLSPLKKIRMQMKMIEHENFDVAANFSGNDEIAMLGRSFNKMSARLKELINQVYATKLRQREAELKALQAQINPHFLYNALDTIYWMGRMEKAFETSRLVEALAKLFRLSLNSGREITRLKDEAEHLSNYMVIQQKRYGDSIHFKIDIEDDLLDCIVIKLILQPLVENSINHGIDKKNGKGNITVSIKKEGSNLVYKIQDDGIGVDVEEINRLLQSAEDSNRGFGIKNVNDRLKLYFGEQYGIEYFSGKGEGTTVMVVQPYTKGEKEIGQGSDC